MELANLKSENLASKNSIKIVVECLVQMKGMNASSSGKGYTPPPIMLSREDVTLSFRRGCLAFMCAKIILL